MPDDPIDIIHNLMVDSQVYDDTDAPQDKVAKAKAFVSQSRMSPAKQAWILNGVASAANRQPDMGATNGAQAAEQIQRTSDLARVSSGYENTANLPMGLGIPSNILHRGLRSTIAGAETGIRGIADVAVGPGNKLSNYLKQDAADIVAPVSGLGATTQKAVDIGGNMLPMMSPLGAVAVGAGQGAALAGDYGAGRGTQATAGVGAGLVNAFLPGQASKLAGRAAAPVVSQVPTALARTVLGDVAQGAGTGLALGIGNTLAQIPTAMDVNSLKPVTDQAEQIPEQALLGGIMHPALAGARRFAEVPAMRARVQQAQQAEQEQAALAQRAQTDKVMDSQAALSDQRAQAITTNEQQDKYRAAIDTSLTDLAMKAGTDPADVIAQVNARAQEHIANGIPDMPARVKAAQEIAPNLRSLIDYNAQMREAQATARMNERQRQAQAPELANQDALAQQRSLLSRTPGHEVARAEEPAPEVIRPIKASKPVAAERPDLTGEHENTELMQLQQQQSAIAERIRALQGGDRAQETPPVAPTPRPVEPPPAPRETAATPPEKAISDWIATQPREVQAVAKTMLPHVDVASDPHGALGNLQQLVMAAQEKPNASQVRSNPRQPTQEGLQSAGRQNLSGQDIQQQPQERATASNAPGPVEQRMQASIDAANAKLGVKPTARTVVAQSAKGSIVAEGGKVWIEDKNGRQYAIKPDSPAQRETYAKAIGASTRPKELEPVRPSRPAEPLQEEERPEGESAELKPDQITDLSRQSPLGDTTPQEKIAAAVAERNVERDPTLEGGIAPTRRSNLGRRGSFDPVRLLSDALDKGAEGFGAIARAAKDALGRIPTEEELQSLRAQYADRLATAKAAQTNGFWAKPRAFLSMEAVAALDPKARRIVASIQRELDNKNAAVAQNMRDFQPVIDLSREDQRLLARAAQHFIFEKPTDTINKPMVDGTVLPQHIQDALKAGFDATRKATADFVADLNKIKGNISDELERFRGLMEDLSNAQTRYLPMRRFGDKIIRGSADTDAVLQRLTSKGSLTPEERTILRLAQQAKVAGDKRFTTYYGAAESETARRTLYETDAAKYEAAAGEKLSFDNYSPDYDRARALGFSQADVLSIAKQAGLEPNAIVDLLSAMPMRGARSSALETRGVPGASTDVVRAAGKWFTNLASIRAKAGEALTLARAMERIDDPAMRQRMSDYIDAQSKPVSPAVTAAKSFLNLFAMALRPASAAAEGVGGAIMAPYKLGAIGLPKLAAQSFGEMASSNILNLWRLAHLGKVSMVDAAKSKAMDDAMRADMQRSADTGRFGNQAFRDEMAAQSKSLIQNLTEKGMILHKNLREANALGVWAAAYKAARSGVIPEHAAKALEMQGIDCGDRSPRAMADAITDFTMNRVDKTTMPMWQHTSAAGAFAGTLTSYQTRSLAQMIDIAKVWKNMPETRLYGGAFTTALVAMFGAGALPFGNWLMQAHSLVDDDPRDKETQALSDTGTRLALYGAPGYAAETVAKSLGADESTAKDIGHRFDAFSRRTAWGNLLHENSLSLADQIPATSLLHSIGASAAQGWEGVERGDWWTAAEGAAGTMSLAAKDVVKAARGLTTGKVVNNSGDTITTEQTPGEAIGQLTGFGNNAAQVAGADTSTRIQIDKARRTALKRFAYKLAITINSGEDISDIVSDIRDWNRKYADIYNADREKNVYAAAMILDDVSIDNAVKEAYTREMLGAHQSNVNQAKDERALLLQQND